MDYFADYVEYHIEKLGVDPATLDWEDQVDALRAEYLTPLEVAERIVNQ